MAVNVGRRTIKDTPANRQLGACWKAHEFCVHTLKICSNENIFLPEYKEALTTRILDTATSIYINCWKANNILVTNKADWNTRSQFQEEALMDCNAMLALMELARTLFHLKGKKVQYWQNLCIEARTVISAWHFADMRRYKNFGM